jgi:hypothetical protein
MSLHHRHCFPTLHPTDYQSRANISTDIDAFASLRCSGYPQQQQQQPGSGGHRMSRHCDLQQQQQQQQQQHQQQQHDSRNYSKSSLLMPRHQLPLANCLRSSGGYSRQAIANGFDGADRFFGGSRLTADERPQRVHHQAATSSNGGATPDITSPYNVTSLYNAACADQRPSITVAMTTCFQSGCGSLML